MREDKTIIDIICVLFYYVDIWQNFIMQKQPT